jgi:demethylspheroidene O-methyltransferase
MPPRTQTLARAPGSQAYALTWQDRVFAWRDRMCANPTFQHWFAAFPLTRRAARNRARAAFDLCAGFVYSQILSACIELDLLKHLGPTPKTAEELAFLCGVPLGNMERLLAAAASLDLASRRARGRWGLGTTGAGIIGTPGVCDMIRHHAILYDDLRNPVALLRADDHDCKLKAFWVYARSGESTGLDIAKSAEYSTLMARSQEMISRDVISAYPLHKQQHLLDVGGGEGGFASAVAKAAPQLKLSIFDLPAVASLAEAKLSAQGLRHRIKIYGGDFFATPLPLGADIITLVRILHDHDDAEALILLKSICNALPVGGKLLIAEPMSTAEGGNYINDAYFGFYLLAMGSGRPRTPAEVRALLSAAGFRTSRSVSTARPMLINAIIAVR